MPERGPDSLPLLQLLPNAVTILGLCCGLTAIRYTMMGRFDLAAILIVLAAVIDGLDGTLARRLDAASPFGAELDSLSDFLAFGVAPGLLMYQFALSDVQGFGWIAVLVYTICACLRLARFNVNRSAPEAGRPHFVGVPAPGGAMLALLPLFLTEVGLLNAEDLPLACGIHVGLVGLLMASTVPTPSSKALRIPRDKAGLALVALATLVGIALTRFWVLMSLISLCYALVIAVSVLRHVIRRLRKRQRGA